MRVKNLLNLGFVEYGSLPSKAGEIHEVPDNVGALMVKRGHAKEVKAKPAATPRASKSKAKETTPKSED